MNKKVSAEDLAHYVECASNLAENLIKDVNFNDNQISDDTADALEEFINAAQVIEYLTNELKSDKRTLN